MATKTTDKERERKRERQRRKRQRQRAERRQEREQKPKDKPTNGRGTKGTTREDPITGETVRIPAAPSGADRSGRGASSGERKGGKGKDREKEAPDRRSRDSRKEREKGKGKDKGKSKDDEEVVSGLPGPPLGTYDPALDAELRSSRRGLSDTIFDTKRGRRISRQDVVTALAILKRGKTRGKFDLGQDKDRGLRDIGIKAGRAGEDIGLDREELLRQLQRALQDFDKADARGGEDFARKTEELDRGYQQLGSRQNDQVNAKGQLYGGAAHAGAVKREANKQFQFQPLQTARQRQVADIATGEQRAQEDADFGLAELARRQARLGQDVGLGTQDLLTDYATARERLGQDAGTQKRQTLRDYQRGQQTSRIDLSRAKREQGIYEADVTAQKYFDASSRDPTLKFPDESLLTGQEGVAALAEAERGKPKGNQGQRQQRGNQQPKRRKGK